MHHWMLWALVLGQITVLGADTQEAGPSQTTTPIPFELASNFLVVVHGGVGNLDDLKFIVDTGSTWSVIDHKVAEKLQLNRRPGRIMNFDRHIRTEWANVTSLRMGPIRAEGVQVMVMDLAKYSEFAKDVDGIIGLDLLTRCRKFTIDYAKKLAYLDPVDKGTSHPSNGFLTAIVVQGVAIHLWVDTGRPDVLLYGDRLRKRLPKLRTEGEAKTVTEGRVVGSRVALPGVRIAGQEEVIRVLLIDGPDEHRMPGIDGYLGTASLHAKRIEFDFAKMVMWWE